MASSIGHTHFFKASEIATLQEADKWHDECRVMVDHHKMHGKKETFKVIMIDAQGKKFDLTRAVLHYAA